MHLYKLVKQSRVAEYFVLLLKLYLEHWINQPFE